MAYKVLKRNGMKIKNQSLIWSLVQMSIQQNFDEHHFDEGSNQELNRMHV